MDWLTFIAQVAGATAWPAAAIAIALIFRARLDELLRTVTRVKAPGIEFERDIEKLESAVGELQPSKPTEMAALPAGSEPTDLSWLSSTATALNDQVSQVAAVSPNAAVVLAWAKLEQKLRDAVRVSLPEDIAKRKISPSAQISALLSASVIDSSVSGMLQIMRDLRNRAAHPASEGDEVPQDEARRYGEVAAALLDYFDSIIRYRSNPDFPGRNVTQ